MGHGCSSTKDVISTVSASKSSSASSKTSSSNRSSAEIRKASLHNEAKCITVEANIEIYF